MQYGALQTGQIQWRVRACAQNWAPHTRGARKLRSSLFAYNPGHPFLSAKALTPSLHTRRYTTSTVDGNVPTTPERLEMAEPEIGDTIKDLHQDLARKWRNHGARIEELWRRQLLRQILRHVRWADLSSQGLRTKAFKAGLAESSVLKHSQDISLGNVYKFTPEYNLRDVTAPGEFLLDMLKHRATRSLQEQYISGFNDRPGDHEHITEMMRTRNLRHANSFKDCWTFFMDEERYGKSFQLLKDKEQALAAFQPAIRAGLCVPQSVGELILNRQLYLLQSLNVICEDILDIGSTTRSQKQVPKKPADAAAAALSNLSIGTSDRAPKPDLPYLVNSTREQKASLMDVLNLMCTEPVFLAHEVNIWFFSRPELVPDEKGRRLPVHTDKYISGAVLEAVHNAVKATAIWEYMTRLMELLESSTDKKHQSLVLQEISNLCQLEYSRTQALVKRQVSTAFGSGSKWFKRVSNAYDNGNARVALKVKPETLATENPQLHCLLRLCQPETTAPKAVEWIKKLDEFHHTHPGAIEDLANREADVLADLAVIVSFIQSLSGTISMPAFNRKKAQLFANKCAALETEMNEIKPEVDISDYAAPIDHLTEPGMTEAALNALDDFIIRKTGTKLGFLYQDLIDECIAQLQDRLKAETERQQKVNADQQKVTMEYVPFPSEVSEEPAVRVQERRAKEKTRPTHSSVYEITTSAQSSAATESEIPQPPALFKVKRSTLSVFSALLLPSESSGSVPWADFEAAMGELGFSIFPKYGSVYTFVPPQRISNQRPLTLHRPHSSRIEGYKLLFYARRLKRVYGWRADTFQLS
ncbi:hypothetical protein SCUP515_12366 [Seiridium cupressi]